MRIISGKYKGRRFTPPSDFRARPTTDFAREGLFNVLSVRYDFEDKNVLDLFAGTGSIGLEFYSRGAEHVVMVEQNRKHASFIAANINKLGAVGAEVVQADVKSFIKKKAGIFDFVFADPPYDLAWLDTIPALVLDSGLMADNALFILEHPKKYSFGTHPSFEEHRHYGSVNFSFFRK